MLQLVVLTSGLRNVKLSAVDSMRVPAGTTIGSSLETAKQPLEPEGSSATPFESQVSDLLKKHNIRKGEVITTAIPPELIVIRYFQMPRLSAQEQKTAVPFEARKYLPYKLEDIIFRYTISYEKVTSNKMAVMFIAVEKATLNNYIRFFENLGLKVGYLEAVPCSLMRFLYYTKDIEINQTVALVHVGHESGSIHLIRNRIIYLTRNASFVSKISQQVSIPSLQRGLADTEEVADNAKLDILLAETKLSFDYFHRQFPEEKIEKMIVWSDSKNIQDWAEKAGKDLNVSIKVSNPFQMIEAAADYSVEYAIGCGLALRALHEPQKDINLSPGFAKIEKEQLVKLAVADICLAVFLLFVFYSSDIGGLKTLEKELNRINSRRPATGLAPANLSKANVEAAKQQLEDKFNRLQGMVGGKTVLTSKINRITQLMPQGLWLNRLDYGTQKAPAPPALILTGYAYTVKKDEQMKTINQFLENLKNDAEFSAGFTEIKMDSISSAQYNDMTFSTFVISCNEGARL